MRGRGKPTSSAPPEPIEIAAYFVASEALANAAKHGRATRVEASRGRDARRDAILTVSDDGVGGAALWPAPAPACEGLADRVRRSAAGLTCAAGPARALPRRAPAPAGGAGQSNGGAGRGSVINRDPRPRVTKLQAQRRSTSTRLWKPTR